MLVDVFVALPQAQELPLAHERNLRDYQLQLDNQADQIFAMTDATAERSRKIDDTILRSISDIAGRQRILKSNASFVDPQEMLAKLHGDNTQLLSEMRRVHKLCDGSSLPFKHGDA